MNRLYFGDNLDVLREYVADESVDLIYLDPPFNSKRDYNLLFKTPKGQESDAQITAFEDTWHWGQQAEDEFRQLMQCGNSDVAELMRALRSFLKENDMMAYLTMMANRLLELHRVLKPTGSLYLHCDPTASHYLKIVLDAIFGSQFYRSEITWKRSHAHSDSKQGRKGYGQIADTLLYYTKSDKYTFNVQHTAYEQSYIDKYYRYQDENGRRYWLDNLTGPGGAAKGNPSYEVMGVVRHWRYSKARMQELISQGRIVQTKPGNVPQYKRFLDEMLGVPLQSIWDDIAPINMMALERLGYPTQKPLALLERIISASSNPGDVVLDPFCGCGTAIHAAEKLGRQWIGIDITHLAVRLIEKRMREAFPGIVFNVEGTPEDLDAARDLFQRDPHQFQLWAVSLVNAQPYKGGKKGADNGIDGLAFPLVGKSDTAKVIVSVKGGQNVSVQMVRDLKGVLDREKADIGLFVTLTPPTGPMNKEAVASGHYTSPHHGDFPRVQILTIEELLAGKRPSYPDLSYGDSTLKKAKRDGKKQEQGGLFG